MLTYALHKCPALLCPELTLDQDNGFSKAWVSPFKRGGSRAFFVALRPFVRGKRTAGQKTMEEEEVARTR